MLLLGLDQVAKVRRPASTQCSVWHIKSVCVAKSNERATTTAVQLMPLQGLGRAVKVPRPV